MSYQWHPIKKCGIIGQRRVLYLDILLMHIASSPKTSKTPKKDIKKLFNTDVIRDMKNRFFHNFMKIAFCPVN